MKKLIREMWSKFFIKEAKERYDELDWAKDIYFDVQDFLFNETEKRNKDLTDPIVIFLKELIDRFYAVETADEKYQGLGAYENVYNDMKDLLFKKQYTDFYGIDKFVPQDGG